MSDNSEWPPPPPSLPLHSPNQRSGCVVIVMGILLAFAPLLIVAVAAIFAGAGVWDESSSSLGALPWLMIFTFPAGGVVCIIGLAKWISELTQRRKRR